MSFDREGTDRTVELGTRALPYRLLSSQGRRVTAMGARPYRKDAAPRWPAAAPKGQGAPVRSGVMPVAGRT